MFSYKTKVRIIPSILKEEVQVLKESYDRIDPKGTKSSHEARSAFSRWNNLNHFYLRLTHQEKSDIIFLEEDEESVVIDVVASAKGNSARVYFRPSITSLTKEMRKAIVPLNKNNVFIYTDIKAAEFALRAVQAGDQEALNAYQAGEDIYMHYSNLFPEGTERRVIKTILIANMYGKSAYSTALDLGISETQAQRLLDSIAQRMPKFTMLKRSIAAYAQRHHGYFSPRGFDQTNLIKVADYDVEFNPNMAWSAYTQSALGFIMQDFTTNLIVHQRGVEGTILSVFDSVIVEISPESKERFEDFFKKNWSPLIPDNFKTGKTMYSAMYE